MRGATIYTAIQKPLIEPILWASIPLSPVLWALQWLSYLNGSTHRSTHRSGFSGDETREQLDFVAKFSLYASPAVLSRGALGMLHWDGTGALAGIGVPVLVFGGRKDPTTKVEASEEIARRIPGAELVVHERAKHMGVIEFNEDFARRVEGLAERLGTAERSTAARGDVGAVEDRFGTEKAQGAWDEASRPKTATERDRYE
jgi:pimeloyl-ACP methyl ester carboxylesterase